MIAYKIKVNGKHVVTAGQDDWSHLSAILYASRDNRCVGDYVRLTFGGLSKENGQGIRQHFRWPDVELEVGAKVEIEVVDVKEVDPPKKRYRSDSEVQENPFTEEELKEMRYNDYLELKKEFENNEVS